MTDFHRFMMRTIDGAPKALGDYRGTALLVVNVASKCGLTPQYAELQRLHDDYGSRGFAVVGFPCNQFGGQEPGSEADIKTFCSTTYGVTFPMFAKVDVNGNDRAPLYAWLTAQATMPEGAGDIRWNFTKFVIDRQGAVVARFEPATSPADPALRQAVEGALI